jgi:hypothetical protein
MLTSGSKRHASRVVGLRRQNPGLPYRSRPFARSLARDRKGYRELMARPHHPERTGPVERVLPHGFSNLVSKTLPFLPFRPLSMATTHHPDQIC